MNLATLVIGKDLEAVIGQGKISFMMIRATAVARLKKERKLKVSLAAIKNRIEAEGMSIIYCYRMAVNDEQLKEFYREHNGKFFFNDLIEATTGGCIVIIVYEQNGDAVGKVRRIIGATQNPEVGSVRHFLRRCDHKGCNSIHGADASSSVVGELSILFEDGGLPNSILLAIIKIIRKEEKQNLQDFANRNLGVSF